MLPTKFQQMTKNWYPTDYNTIKLKLKDKKNSLICLKILKTVSRQPMSKEEIMQFNQNIIQALNTESGKQQEVSW